MTVNHWGTKSGQEMLERLNKLYTALVWESTVLLAFCTEEALPPGCPLGREDLEKIIPKELLDSALLPPVPPKNLSMTQSSGVVTPRGLPEETASNGVRAALESLSTQDEPVALGATTSIPAQMETQTLEPTRATSGDKKDKKPQSPLLQAKLKHIKPLLNATSRLGKALSEFFSQLVKYCVSTPPRQRRLQSNAPTPTILNATAKNVTESIAKLLVSGLRWKPPKWSPVPKLHLTFFICSTGFVAPMVFDEKKQPFHAMLYKFVEAGGLEALYESFSWALNSGWQKDIQDTSDDELPQGTGDFLDAWLTLVEKMVNVKVVLGAPHVLGRTAGSSAPQYNPLKFLTVTHKMAFDAVMQLWGRPVMKTFGRWMAESVLSILCEIIKGQSEIKVWNN